MKRLAALAAVPLLLTAGLIGLGGGHASAVPRAAQPTPTQTCILIILCSGGSSSPSPSSSASASLPAPSASASSPGASGTASPPTPTAGPTVTSSPTPSPSPSASATPSASGPSGAPSPVVTTTSGGKRKVTPKDGSVSSGLVASSATWEMSVDSATMTKFTYLGNVNMPVAGGGAVTMMEFTADSMTMSGVTTVITEDGLTGKETDAGFTASGVTLYATRLSGSIFGAAPVTFTPSNAGVLGLANLLTGLVPITMTGVTADQAIILAAQAQKTGVAAVG